MHRSFVDLFILVVYKNTDGKICIFRRQYSNHMFEWTLTKSDNLVSDCYHHTPKWGWPGHLATNVYGSGYSGQFEFFWTTLTMLQNWVWSYYAVLKIRRNAEIVCHELTVMIRVADDIQSSSRQNSGGRRLVLKPLLMLQGIRLVDIWLMDFDANAQRESLQLSSVKFTRKIVGFYDGTVKALYKTILRKHALWLVENRVSI